MGTTSCRKRRFLLSRERLANLALFCEFVRHRFDGSLLLVFLLQSMISRQCMQVGEGRQLCEIKIPSLPQRRCQVIPLAFAQRRKEIQRPVCLLLLIVLLVQAASLGGAVGIWFLSARLRHSREAVATRPCNSQHTNS